MSNLDSLSATIVSLVLTYLLHSTILICAAWVIVATFRNNSFTLSEQAWKLACVTAVATAVIQVTFGISTTPVDFALTTNESPGPSMDDVAINSGEKQRETNVDGAVEEQTPQELSPSESVDLVISTGRFHEVTPSVDSALSSERLLLAPEILDDSEISKSDDGGFLGNKITGHRDDERNTVSTHIDAAVGDERLPVRRVSDSEGLCESNVGSLTVGMRVAAGTFSVFVALGLMGIIFQAVAFRRRMWSEVEVQNELACRVLQRLLKRNNISRNVRLLSSNLFSEPVAFGLRHWTIVLPVGLEDELSKEELRALLAHELAHLVRGDVWWLWMGRVICSCLAFQPLNLVARCRWQQAAECLCDDWAVENGASAISLARCLTQIAQWRLQPGNCAVALAAGGPKKTIVRRVERLVNATSVDDRRTGGVRRRIFTANLVVLVVAFLVFAPRLGFTAGNTNEDANRPSVPNEGDDPTLDAAGAPGSDLDANVLTEELRQLDRELRRADELSQRLPNDPDIQTLAEQLRYRTMQIRIHSRTELGN